MSIALLLMSSQPVQTANAGPALQSPASQNQTGPEIIRIYSSFPVNAPGGTGAQALALVNAMNMALEQQARNRLVCRSRIQIEHIVLNGPASLSLVAAPTAMPTADPAMTVTLAAPTLTPTPRATTRPLTGTALVRADAQRVIADPDAMLLMGTLDDAADKAILPLLANANLLMITPSDAYPGLTKAWATGEPQTYQPNGTLALARVVPSDDAQGEVGAKWAKSMGVRRVYILHDGSSRGKGLADAFRTTATSIQLVDEGYDDIQSAGTTTARTALINKIKNSEAQMVYMGVDSAAAAGAWIKDIRSAGLNELLILGNDRLIDANTIRAAGSAVTRVFATSPGFPQDRLPARGKRFYTDYEARYDVAPLPLAIYGYEAMSVAVRAISAVCEKDRAAIRAAVLGLKNFNGVLGTWSFDAAGDTSLKSVQGYRVISSTWESTGLLNFK